LARTRARHVRSRLRRAARAPATGVFFAVIAARRDMRIMNKFSRTHHLCNVTLVGTSCSRFSPVPQIACGSKSESALSSWGALHRVVWHEERPYRPHTRLESHLRIGGEKSMLFEVWKSDCGGTCHVEGVGTLKVRVVSTLSSIPPILFLSIFLSRSRTLAALLIL
jgi:hypothetical protein